MGRRGQKAVVVIMCSHMPVNGVLFVGQHFVHRADSVGQPTRPTGSARPNRSDGPPSAPPPPPPTPRCPSRRHGGDGTVSRRWVHSDSSVKTGATPDAAKAGSPAAQQSRWTWTLAGTDSEARPDPRGRSYSDGTLHGRG